MPDRMLDTITAPYTRIEAWGYDTFIAPAVTHFRDHLEAELLGRVPQGGALLDVGCGGGHNLAALARRRPDLRLTGLDLSAGQVARARQRTRGTATTVMQGSALEQPFADGTFDCVMSIASIKHWPDHARGLAECTRVLKPAGAFLLVEADRGCTFEDAMDFVGRWKLPRPLRHASVAFFMAYVAGRSLDLAEARELMAALPLEDVRVDRLAGAPAFMIRGTRAS